MRQCGIATRTATEDMELEMTWILVHPNGYTSPEYEDLPESLLQSSKGVLGLKYPQKRDKIHEVREWTGSQWRELQGDDREFALNWITSEFGSGQQEGRQNMADTETSTAPKTTGRKRPARKRASARKAATKRKATPKRKAATKKTATKARGGRKSDPMKLARNKKIVAARKKGQSYAEIAEEFGLAPITVYGICTEAMPETRKKRSAKQ